MNELKPCPFCGDKPVVDHIGNDHTKLRRVKIKCPTCRIQRTEAGRIMSLKDLELVAEINWNQRKDQPNDPKI